MAIVGCSYYAETYWQDRGETKSKIWIGLKLQLLRAPKRRPVRKNAAAKTKTKISHIIAALSSKSLLEIARYDLHSSTLIQNAESISPTCSYSCSLIEILAWFKALSLLHVHPANIDAHMCFFQRCFWPIAERTGRER